MTTQKSGLQARKEREKKPWLSEIYRRFGTPIGPLNKIPAHISMNGRRVGISLNNIGVLRAPEFKVMTVEDAIRQVERKKRLENQVMNPLQNEVIQNEVIQNEVLQNVEGRSSANQTQKHKRPEPKRLSNKKLIKKNANILKRPEPKRRGKVHGKVNKVRDKENNSLKRDKRPESNGVK